MPHPPIANREVKGSISAVFGVMNIPFVRLPVCPWNIHWSSHVLRAVTGTTERIAGCGWNHNRTGQWAWWTIVFLSLSTAVVALLVSAMQSRSKALRRN